MYYSVSQHYVSEVYPRFYSNNSSCYIVLYSMVINFLKSQSTIDGLLGLSYLGCFHLGLLLIELLWTLESLLVGFFFLKVRRILHLLSPYFVPGMASSILHMLFSLLTCAWGIFIIFYRWGNLIYRSSLSQGEITFEQHSQVWSKK